MSTNSPNPSLTTSASQSVPHQQSQNTQKQQPNDDETDGRPSQQQVDLPTLISELQRITAAADKVLGAIQHSVDYSSQASLILSKLTLDQLSELSNSTDNLNNQVRFIVDLFSTLQMKMTQLNLIITFLPQYEKELDLIIEQLPYLEKRVKVITQGIKNGTYTFIPPSTQQQSAWESVLDQKERIVVERQNQLTKKGR